MEWKFMVMQRHYRNGVCETGIIERDKFREEDFPEDKERYEQKFFPCKDRLPYCRKIDCESLCRSE